VGRATEGLRKAGGRLLVASFRVPLTPSAARATRDGLVVAGVILALVNYWWLIHGPSPVDVGGWWSADPHRLYADVHGGFANKYMYSPAWEFVMAPLRSLDLATVAALWRAAQFVVLAYLAGPFLGFVLFLVPVQSELNVANIQIFMALAIVAGFRWPATWALLVLTKATPGLGLLWFAIRREWRALAIALSATALIAGVSFALHPSLWGDWITLLTANPAPVAPPYYLSFWVRLPFALAAIVLAALTGRRWLLVVGTTLALPVVYWVSASMLVGVLPYARAAIGRALARWFAARAAWRADRRAAASGGIAITESAS
jgi:Glycosyltransferase family 87